MLLPPPNGDLKLCFDSISSALSEALQYFKYVVFCEELNVLFSTPSLKKTTLNDVVNSFLIKVKDRDPRAFFKFFYNKLS